MQFSLNDPKFIADIKRQLNGLKDDVERSAALEAHRIALSKFGISDEEIEQFFNQLDAE
jgi:hypothetical protein